MRTRWIIATALGIGLGLGVAIAPARADCVDDCISSTYCDNAMHASGECARRQSECYRLECNKPTRLYGALAYGAGSAAAGWSYDYDTKDDAERHALANCAAHGDDCKIVASFSNSCAAVAAGTNKRFATGDGDEAEDAQANAMAACKRAGGKECEIQAWSCTKP